MVKMKKIKQGIKKTMGKSVCLLSCVFLLSCCLSASAQAITKENMQKVYDEVRTPYKYGLVVAPNDNYHKYDCPTVFRQNGKWLMTYVCYDGKDGTDGRGYETWIAESDDLLHWSAKGRVLALPENQGSGANDDNETKKPNKPQPLLWDHSQRGGFPSLVDYNWGGTYELQAYRGRRWMTYIGGQGTGYEAVRAPLSIGIASTREDATTAHQWDTQEKPLMSYNDKDAQWWEHLTQYKSTVYWLHEPSQRIEGKEKFPFVMFYNAGGKNDTHPKGERIGIALSKDMRHWERYQGNPVFGHDSDGTITGDAQIVRMDSLWVMFYFSAYNPTRKYNAYNTFAVSRDLVHWQDWDGPDLIWPTKKYDEMFAHKSYVVKHDGIVYHFYCAVNNDQQRGIAVATSVPLGRSAVHFPKPEPTGRRRHFSLNDGWTARCLTGRDTVAKRVNIPHNFDDYYGYRQLRHGNLHGAAKYCKDFQMEKLADKRYFLQLEGVGTYATVSLNDSIFAKELVGRTVFTLDVTDALKNGTNRLIIDVDHPAMLTESPWVCGGCSSEWGFSEGSQPFGIFRPVTLVETDVVRIEPFGVHVWNNAACDSLFIDTEVHNYGAEPVSFELVNKFSEKSGKQVFRQATPLSLQPGETKTVHLSAPVTAAHRWSLDDPYLYTLATIIKCDGKTTDDLRTPFGIRSLRWLRSKDHRFYLNDQPVFINGTCEYEHLFGSSHAFSHEQIASRVKQIRNAGFNAFREAHQPHNLYYQQLFDEQGILFWSQFSAHIWYDTPSFRDNFKRLLVRWIKERRNSPSVILWGLQNESVLPREFAEECSDIIRSLDPTASTQRLITTCNGGEGTDWNVVQNWSGTYGGKPENYDKELKQTDQLLNGEYGAWRTIDLHGADKYSEESFTALLQLKARLAEQARDSVCGHFQWLFSSHDNPGRVQPDGALRRIDKVGPINYKGLTTIWEEPTSGYYMYRESHTPTVGALGMQGIDSLTPADRNYQLLKGSPSYSYLYRINCGGDDIIDEFGQQWLADDTLYSHSWGQDFAGIHPYQASQRHIVSDIKGTDSDELFQFFRFGRHRLWYDFPVSDESHKPHESQALYRIELYFVEPWHGRDATETADYEGLRIFDVAVNDSVVIDDLDPWAEAGYCGALKRVITAPAKNGRLHISFPEVKAGQAVIAAIAIAKQADGGPETNVPKEQLKTQRFSWHALDTDTIARLPKEDLPQDTDVRPPTVYEPQNLKSQNPITNPTTFIIQPGIGQEYALRFHYKNTTGYAIKARLKLIDSNKAILVDREISFPPTPNKFKMLSTTTGTQINAGTYRLTVEAANLEISNLEIQ